jgi:phenylacetaldehyde dehydrogenase
MDRTNTAGSGLRAGAQPSSVIRVFDPSTEEQIGEVKDGGAQAIDEAVARARETFHSGAWREKTASERARILWSAAELIERRADELAGIDSRNVGMSQAHARNLVYAGAEVFRYFSGWCTKIYGKAADLKMAGGITGGTADLHAYTLKAPIGVAGLIVPWNGPVFNAIAKLVPSLTAGCSSVKFSSRRACPRAW